MKQFFSVLFGGLVLIFLGIILVWGFGQVNNKIAGLNKSDDPDAVVTDGLRKVIRYTANEEEGVINSAIENLPRNNGDRITADAYIVKNLSTDSVWTEYDATRLRPVASLTKLVTAVVARRMIQADTRIEITPQIISTFGNTAGFRAGEIFTASDLMYPLMMVSSNDAAEAFARKYGRTKFIRVMNDFVQSIGAYRTYFADPSGLSKANVSTATDLAIIIDWIRRSDPSLLEITTLKSKTVRNHTWVNPTHFLSWSYYMGGKNGYTDEAGRTSVSLFRLGYDKEVYAVVVLGSDNRDEDVVRLINKVK
ncbi:MAG: serine hydrolase [Candidatus Taylorbacteria bacterium]|nr:serine hydrolase [Candidatus Taylorbacteria bacterium]